MAHLLGMGVGLLAFWLLLSGHYTALLIGFGVASVLLVVLVAHRMDVADRESVPFSIIVRAVTYLPWLTLEVLKSNLSVLGVVLKPQLDIEPSFGLYEGHEKTTIGRFIYANSITLTPGTITTGVYGTRMEVHALNRTALAGTEEGEMDRRIVRLEDGADPQVLPAEPS